METDQYLTLSEEKQGYGETHYHLIFYKSAFNLLRKQISI